MHRICKSVYKKMIETLGTAPIESGGIIGKKNGIVCAFYFDDSDIKYSDKYVPDFKKLNGVIEKWFEDEIYFAGIVHSHPGSCAFPSEEDGIYLTELMGNNPYLKKVLFPIVTKNNGELSVAFFEFTGNFKKIEVTLC